METSNSRGGVRHARVERLVGGGYGLVRTDDGVVLLTGAIPGETVAYVIRRRSRGVAYGDVRSVEDRSPDRVEPRCPYFGECGGCQWQHLRYERQVKEKGSILRENLARLGGVEADDLPIGSPIAGAPWGYRSRVQIHRQNGTVGYVRRGSSEVVGVRSCPIANGAINAWMEDRRRLPPLERFAVWGGTVDVAVEGLDSFAEASLMGRSLRFHVGSFFQSNLTQLERAARAIESSLLDESCHTLVDLYGGAGVLSALLADRVETTLCVEADPNNGDLINENAGASVYAVVGTAERFLTGERARRLDWKRAMVIVDPPRRGLSRAVRRGLLARLPARVAYLSCDAAALARDVGDLASRYRIVSGGVYDFYPQTAHIESLLILDRVA